MNPKEEQRLLNKFLKHVPSEEIKTDKHGKITNWNELSPQTKAWIKRG